MMRSRSSVVVIVWLVALCCDVTGFSIRRPSSSKSDLSEAFRALERQRRRIRDDEYLAASRMPDPRAPISPSEVPDWGQDAPSREEQAWIQNAFGISPYDDRSYAPEEFVDEPESEESPGAKTVEPSQEELQGIFGDTSGSQTKDAEDSQARADASAAKPTDNLDESQENDSDSDNLTEDEFKALMSAVEKLQKRALVKKDTKNSISKLTTPDPQPVSKEELSVVFGESGDDGNSEPSSTNAGVPSVVAMDTTSEEIDPSNIELDIQSEAGNSIDDDDQGLSQKYKDRLSSIERYWQLHDYYNPDEKRRKRFTKRAPVAKPPDAVPLEETYLQEIQTLRNEIQQLKLLAQLEDMENDALTQTLNEATLSQMEGTVSVKEFGSLEQAIKLEEALQDLKNGKVNPLIVELIAADAVGDLKKRGEPLWKKKEKRMDEGDLEESYPMYPSDKRDSKRDLVEGGYILLPDDKRSFKREQEEDVDRWYDRPAREDRTEEQDRYQEAQDAIDAMVGRLAESEMAGNDNEDTLESDDEDDDMLTMPSSYLQNTDTDVIPYSTDTDSKPGQCPSVSLVTDCKFADLQGLPIDDEARELCNRHELCYECGASSGVKQGECDNLYRGDAALLCEKDANCVIEAELFLQEMKLKHRYSMYYKAMCDNSCTADYIGL